MIFIRYDANGEELRINENGLIAPTCEKKPKILPSRPIPNPARRNYLLPDRVKIEAAKKAKENKLVLKEKFQLKYLFVFLLQNFGILFVSFAYILVGAYIFQFIEQPNEIALCQTGESKWQKLLYDNRVLFYNYIYYNTTSNSFLLKNNPYAIPSLISERDNSTVYEPKLLLMIQDFRDAILSISIDYNYSGQDCVTDSQWNIISAILFTMSIVSTIGYGVKTPKTWQGQFLCIQYALYGIPLFLIGLNKIGNLLSEAYKYVYMTLISYIFNGREKIAKRMTRKNNESTVTNEDNFDGVIFNFYGKENYQHENDQEDKNDKEENEKKVTVPLFLVLLSVIGYLMFGGYFFTQLGDDWTLVQSIYASYQSISTIGFGDLVSGWTFIQNNQPGLGGRNLLMSCCYSILGMSILGMTFNLMQDTIKAKFEQIKNALNSSKESLKKEAHISEKSNENQIDEEGKKNPFEEKNFKSNSPIDILKDQLAFLKSMKEEKALLKAKELLGVEDKKKFLSEKIKQQRLSTFGVKKLPKLKSKPELPPEARPTVNNKNKSAFDLKIYEKLNNL